MKLTGRVKRGRLFEVPLAASMEAHKNQWQQYFLCGTQRKSKYKAKAHHDIHADIL